MMRMSSIMDGNRQEGKWLIVEHKALKWAKANSASPKDHLKESPWQLGWLWHHLDNYIDCKLDKTQMYRMHE